MKGMENLTYQPDAAYVAACGLYCGACRKFVKEQCPGCWENKKADWCKIRACNIEHNYKSCADCTISSIDECKKFNNFIGKVFSILFRPVSEGYRQSAMMLLPGKCTQKNNRQ